MEVQYIGRTFFKSKFDSLEGKTVVAWQEQSNTADPFTVKVDSEGMWFEGKLSTKIITQSDLQSFAKMISDCWVEHSKLAPKIVKSLSGH